MRTEFSYCQSHESSRYSSFVFVAVLILRSSTVHLFTDILDQLCGSCDYRHLRFQADNVLKLTTGRRPSLLGCVTDYGSQVHDAEPFPDLVRSLRPM